MQQVLTLIVIFYYHLVGWLKLQIHAVGGPSDFMWVYTGYQERKGLHTRTVKIGPHKCWYLKQPYTSYIFKIYKKHLLLCCKTEKLKITVLGVFRQEKYYLQQNYIRHRILHFKIL